MSGKPAKRAYAPLPKLKAGHQNGPATINRAKLRDMYINGKSYSWAEFCKEHQFHPKNSFQIVFGDSRAEFINWKQDWTKRQLECHDEELSPQMLETTKLVAMSRIKFVGDWQNRAKYLKTLFDATLDMHGKNLKADMTNPLVQNGTLPGRFKLSIDDLSTFAAVGLKLQELELRSLLVVANVQKLERLSNETEEEAEETTEIEVHPIGKSMTTPEITQLMSSYFDQYTPPDPKAIEPPPVEEPSEEDQV